MNTVLVKGKIGKEYTLVSLGVAEGRMNQRLQELGFVKGARLVIKAISPHHQTLLVSILGSMFALKSEIAEQMVVSEC